MSREWLSLLDDILECCRRVRTYTNGLDQAAFVNNTMAYDAVLRNLEIIGEAAKRMPRDVREQMSQVEWTKIVGMRNWLAHAYFVVNIDIVWDVIENKLPELQQAVQACKNADDSPL